MQTAKDSQSYDKDGKSVFSIDGTSYDKREEAGKALLGLVGVAVRADHPVLVGHYAGFEVTVAYAAFQGVCGTSGRAAQPYHRKPGSDAAGNMVRLQMLLLPCRRRSAVYATIYSSAVQLDSAKEELQQSFYRRNRSLTTMSAPGRAGCPAECGQ